MPELPEVQTIVNDLSGTVVGKRIESVQVFRDAIVQLDPERFVNRLTDTVIRAVYRRGKYIVFELSGPLWMVVHLRMTGKFSVQPSPAPVHIHNRVIFQLGDRQDMIFNDLRCFGTIDLTEQIDKYPALNQLGLDPWDHRLTAPGLYKVLQHRTANIKSLLLNQTIIAGLGNIYVSEILFDACIHPDTKGYQLSKKQVTQLLRSTRTILSDALTFNGTSISDYRRVDDKQGTFQNFLKVYGKAGSPCHRCASTIQKIKQNQRSTFYCSQCQQKKRSFKRLPA